MQPISPIINASELISLLANNEVVIIDARSGPEALSNYDKKHITNARFVDLNEHMSTIGEDAALGGRHPLPSIDTFSETLRNLGITSASHVVIYDDKNGANAAARFWWMLTAIGHKKVQVLNGGFQEAEREGLPMDNNKVVVKKTALYPAEKWVLPMIEMNQAAKNAQSDHHILIDVRAEGRYAGEYEPIDLIAGHIPGAINVPFSENLDENGLFLSPDKLKAKYQKILRENQVENTAIHCGSGVTACHTILAMAYAGMDLPALYVGSWSEWSRNDNPMILKD